MIKYKILSEAEKQLEEKRKQFSQSSQQFTQPLLPKPSAVLPWDRTQTTLELAIEEAYNLGFIAGAEVVLKNAPHIPRKIESILTDFTKVNGYSRPNFIKVEKMHSLYHTEELMLIEPEPVNGSLDCCS